MTVVPVSLLVAYAFGIGAIVGSFLNVVIARLPAGESIVRPRSKCPRCGHAIAWFDNIPIVSYLVLRARCRHCAAPIAVRYPLVELLMGCLSVALLVRFGLSWPLLLWLPLTAALLAIAFLDIDHFWVPDVITFPAMAAAFAGSFLPGCVGPLGALVGLAPAVFLWLFALVFARLTGKEGMGLGDIKLLAVIGLGLGLLPTASVLLLAAVQGSLIGGLLLLLGRQHPRPPPSEGDDWVPPPRAIPFGPFLVLGTYEVLLLPYIFGNLPEHLARLGAW
jgi:leader peptidase (prepilin peptidase) / N-methyltransferase